MSLFEIVANLSPKFYENENVYSQRQVNLPV